MIRYINRALELASSRGGASAHFRRALAGERECLCVMTTVYVN